MNKEEIICYCEIGKCERAGYIPPRFKGDDCAYWFCPHIPEIFGPSTICREIRREIKQ